jgi:AcrR family transcriptional regulator
MAKSARKARTQTVPQPSARRAKVVAASSGAAPRQHHPARAPNEAPSAAMPSSRRRWMSSPRAALPRTRLEDVAKRADVAKGTIYLHFADKETLFQELVRLELSPVVGALERASHADVSFRQVTDQLIEVFVREIFETRRKDVIRLVLTEGPRFPKLAEFYYREVIARAMEAIRAILRRAHERGETEFRRAGAFSTTPAGAGHRRNHLERVVRSLRTARYPRDDAGLFRRAVR